MKKTRQSGITLVALVVTIVVLLILAGVSISLVLGQNGLIANAKEAREKTKNATDEESQLINGTIPDYIAEQVNGTTSGVGSTGGGETPGGGNTPTEPETPTTSKDSKRFASGIFTSTPLSVSIHILTSQVKFPTSSDLADKSIPG